MSELIVVERELPEPSTLDELRAREHAVSWCFDQYSVRFLRTYFAVDRRRMVCLYRAPDVEAVRATQREADLPVTHAWVAEVLGASDAPAVAPGASTVIIQRELAEPMTPEMLAAEFAVRGHCLPIYRADLHVSHLSRDGLRTVCVFTAPDAESVRLANRQMGLSASHVWPATVHVSSR